MCEMLDDVEQIPEWLVYLLAVKDLSKIHRYNILY